MLLVVLVGLVWVGFRSFTSMAEANRWSLHTYDVLSETEGMLEALVDMETSFRGFALTAEPRMAAAWGVRRADFHRHADRVQRLTGDNPRQQRRIRAVRALADRWVSMQRATGFDARMAPDRLVAVQHAITGTTRPGARSAVMAEMRDTLGAMVREESSLLVQRAAHSSRLERRTTLLLGLGGVFGTLLASGLALMVTRRSRHLANANTALATEIAERRLAQRAAEHLSRQNEMILESADEGICGVDVQGYVTFLNWAASRLLDRADDDAIARPVETVLVLEGEGAGGDAAQTQPVRETLRTGHTQRLDDVRMRRSDGSSFPVELVSSPVLYEGQMAGAVVTFRDVSERREVERMKDEFVSVVSHELRTPLTSLRGSLGLLASGRAGAIPPHGQRLLDIAVQNTDRLVRLINDILDLERLRSGKHELEPRPTPASELLRSAADVMEAMADRAKVRLSVVPSPVPVMADPDRILQVITNLVSNAIKFSPPEGAVTLQAEREGGLVLFSVRDQGRGIPHDKLELIFERFQQVDSSDARQKGGTGLGLAICRGIVEQHGGRIWAESDPGEGSTFFFTLQVVDGSEPPSEPAAGTGGTESALPTNPSVRGSSYDPDAAAASPGAADAGVEAGSAARAYGAADGDG